MQAQAEATLRANLEARTSPSTHVIAASGGLLAAALNGSWDVFLVAESDLATGVVVAAGTYVALAFIFAAASRHPSETVFLGSFESRARATIGALVFSVPVFLAWAGKYSLEHSEYGSAAAVGFLALTAGIPAVKIVWAMATARPTLVLGKEAIAQGGYLIGRSKNWPSLVSWDDIAAASLDEAADDIVFFDKSGKELARAHAVGNFLRRDAILRLIADRTGRPLGRVQSSAKAVMPGGAADAPMSDKAGSGGRLIERR